MTFKSALTCQEVSCLPYWPKHSHQHTEQINTITNHFLPYSFPIKSKRTKSKIRAFQA
ncbi:hypothetical protein Peur_071277 [Populus x canadensis]